MLQAPLRSRQTARYEARIKEQTVRYHDWILRKEEKERSGRVLEGTGLFVKCVPYGACRASFQVQEAGRDADILVFHADCGKPEEEALRLFADFLPGTRKRFWPMGTRTRYFRRMAAAVPTHG